MGRKLALLIGNSRYDDPGLARLTTADVDVREIADVLRAPEIGEFDEVTELPDHGLAAVRRSIAQFFRQGKKDDLLVFYFSGHGVKDENGHLYLAVKDTELPLLAGTSIEAAFITAQMDRSYSRRQVLILDCCHSGAFAAGTKAAEGQSVGIGPTFEGSGYGHVVLTATDSTQYAWEGDQIIGDSDKSVFTHYLLEGLRTGEADGDGDGQITIDELYEYVFEHVVKETPKQTPGKWSYKQQGEIVIAQNLQSLRPVPLSLELQALVDSPLARLRAEAIPELASLLQGHHRGLALAARRALEQLRTDDSRRVSAAAEELLASLPQARPIESAPDARAVEAAARKQQVLDHLHQARTALDEKRFDDAMVILIKAQLLDPQAEEIAGLIGQAEAARAADETERVQREVEHLLAEGSQRLSTRDFANALAQVNAALQLDPASQIALALHDEIRHASDEAARMEELERAARARSQMANELISKADQTSSHQAAVEWLEEALTLDPDLTIGRDLLRRRRAAAEDEAREVARQQALAAARRQIEAVLRKGELDAAERLLGQAERDWAGAPAFDELRQQLHLQQHNRLAHEAVEGARSEFAAGRHDSAIAALERFRPPHTVVSQAITAFKGDVERLRQEEQRKQAEAERTARTQLAEAGAVPAESSVPSSRSRRFGAGLLAVVAVAALVAYGFWGREVSRNADPVTSRSPAINDATPPVVVSPRVTDDPVSIPPAPAPIPAPSPAPAAAAPSRRMERPAVTRDQTGPAPVRQLPSTPPPQRDVNEQAAQDATRLAAQQALQIQRLLGQGDQLLQDRKYDDAIAAYEEAGRLGSESGRARAEKARQERAAQVRQRLAQAERLLDTGQYTEMFRLIDEALALDQRNAEARTLRQKAEKARDFEAQLRQKVQ